MFITQNSIVVLLLSSFIITIITAEFFLRLDCELSHLVIVVASAVATLLLLLIFADMLTDRQTHAKVDRETC